MSVSGASSGSQAPAPHLATNSTPTADSAVNLGERLTMSSERNEDTASRHQLSCYKYFDALWFCYSPVHQMQQYYRLGALDNCSGKWGALYDCLKLKTKRASEVEEILETREKAVPHVWSFRSPSESRHHWHELFGHLDDQ